MRPSGMQGVQRAAKPSALPTCMAFRGSQLVEKWTLSSVFVKDRARTPPKDTAGGMQGALPPPPHAVTLPTRSVLLTAE